MPPRPPPDPPDLPAMTKVRSSTIYEIGYDDQRFLLYVRFADKSAGRRRPQPGALYRYVKVPRMVWRRFEAAPSAGRFLEEKVKGRYGYSRWTGRAWRPEAVLRVLAAKARRTRALLLLQQKRRSG